MADNTHSFPLEENEPANGGNVRRTFGLAILGALAVVLALIGIDVALINGAQAAPSRPIVTKQIVRISGTAQQVDGTVYMSVSPGIKPGPDGKLHDAFSVTSLRVRAGHPVKLVIDNTDDTVHSITSPAAGVNVVVKPGSHTYTLLVTKTGVFQWYCKYPCDPYSMMHDGYMRGSITSI